MRLPSFCLNKNLQYPQQNQPLHFSPSVKSVQSVAKILSSAWCATIPNYFSATIPPMKMNHHLAPPTGGRDGVRQSAAGSRLRPRPLSGSKRILMSPGRCLPLRRLRGRGPGRGGSILAFFPDSVLSPSVCFEMGDSLPIRSLTSPGCFPICAAYSVALQDHPHQQPSAPRTRQS